MRIPSLLVLLVALPAASVAAPAKKPPGAGKSPPACGAKVLPLVTGNTWTYANVPSPVAVRDDLSRLVPNPAKKVVITVKSVETKGADTVATLEEVVSYELGTDLKTKKPRTADLKFTTTITCGKNKFDISPESFFFAGEPGGMLGLTFDKYERKKGTNLVETDLKLTNGTIGDAKWREDIAAHWKREPTKGIEAKLGSGRIELERSFTPANPEELTLKVGTYKAEHLALLVTGRVYLDDSVAPEGKPCLVRMFDGGKDKDGNPTFKDVADAKCDMPVGWTNELWFVDDIGLAQARNMYGHMYQLTDLNLK
jgi:hypothetical protein